MIFLNRVCFFSEFVCFTVITNVITVVTVLCTVCYCMIVNLSLKPSMKAALNCHCNMFALPVCLLYLTCF